MILPFQEEGGEGAKGILPFIWKDALFPLPFPLSETSIYNTQARIISHLQGRWQSKILSWACGLPWWLRWQRIFLQCQRPGFNSWVGKIPWRRERQPTVVFLHGEFPVQGNSWQATVHGVAKSLTLSLYVLSQTVPKKKGVFLGFP